MCDDEFDGGLEMVLRAFNRSLSSYHQDCFFLKRIVTDREAASLVVSMLPGIFCTASVLVCSQDCALSCRSPRIPSAHTGRSRIWLGFTDGAGFCVPLAGQARAGTTMRSRPVLLEGRERRKEAMLSSCEISDDGSQLVHIRDSALQKEMSSPKSYDGRLYSGSPLCRVSTISHARH